MEEAEEEEDDEEEEEEKKKCFSFPFHTEEAEGTSTCNPSRYTWKCFSVLNSGASDRRGKRRRWKRRREGEQDRRKVSRVRRKNGASVEIKNDNHLVNTFYQLIN